MSIGAIAQPRRVVELAREFLLEKGDRAHARRGAVFAIAIRVLSAAIAA